ncbi:mechanosensitive ion channel family protein [Sulfuriferula nivalis]|uniref:Mechanosensitive ion channel protein n=1 Tax=Sulfuriferula nivalis TaxID=2675298 RepID=A0A809RD46_9PROT|nr:mechanosensitive ion channel domain-containing protein [Sulfuriferula nivalis]BBO99564.1 mechanosensitive ion channel protein [Sulfuriferula nivalis]
MKSPIPFDNLLEHLINDSHQTDLLWQVAILAVCGLISWAIMHWLTPYLAHERATWRIGNAAAKRIGLPITGLLLVFISRAILEQWHETHLLNIVTPLLGSLVIVRILVYMLRFAFNNSETIKTWERYIAWIIWSGFALHITGLLPRIERALDAVSFESGNHHFSLLLLFEALAVITLSIIASLWLAQFIESRLLRITSMDVSLRLALIKAMRTLLVIIAVLVALPAVGIDLTVLSVFGGALGVGLGLGLQKIASNYASGFIILLDRSIRPGDMITVGTSYGEVSQLNTRYTLLRALDGTEIIIPNENLLTSTVINHSFTKRDVRIKLPIQISYDSDVERTRELMKSIALAHKRVLKTEEYTPSVLLIEFADSGINLELSIWINDPENGQNNLRSDLNLAIWQAFQHEGIQIPYPRRDIYMINDANKL